MIRQRHMMQAFVAFIVIALVMMIFLESRNLEKVPNSLGTFFEYFAENDTVIDNSKNSYDEKFNNLTDEFLQVKGADGFNPEKPLTTSKCGYDSCNAGKPGFLNVHLVPHSHDDLGFLNTMDQYYNGEGKIVGVVKVIDSIVEGLKDHPHRKFIFVEIAFFQRWWNSQNETNRIIVKDLVANGQLEFINGGWCMNDEAVAHYVDIIDQMSLGSNFLNETFGECGRPKVGWQIDTFGHSKEHANLMALMGFDGMFLWRLHMQELEERRKSKSLEFLWTGNQNLGVDGKLFTGVLYNGYDPPQALCTKKDHFDESWVAIFLDYLTRHRENYRTTDIMVPVGTDFRIREDFTCFVPTDKLIEHTNKLQETGSKVNLFYSTPSCYVKALNSHVNVIWPSKKDDLYPYLTHGLYIDYSPQDQEYWTGLYTSRPTYKYMVRKGSNLLQSCKQMASYLKMKSNKFVGDISVMKQAMAVMQHHDALPGTSKQFVIDDYVRILHGGFEECLKIQNSFYQNELPKENVFSLTPPKLSYCNLNMSQCDVTEKSERSVVNVYNSLSSYINKYVRVPVVNQVYRVLDPSGKEILCDLIPIPEFVKSIPGRYSAATHELVFLAFQVPPLGSQSYYIEVEKKARTTEVKNITNELFIENQHLKVQLNETNGLLQSISINGEKVELEQEILWYAARAPEEKKYLKLMLRRASGIYIFRPNGTNPLPMRKEDGVSVSIYKGELVQEIHQHYNDWVGQVIRIYKGHDHVELDWLVGPINTDDKVGKEVVNRVKTKLSTKKEFYTDANGRQILKRRVGIHGDSLNISINEPVGANYYPVNAFISIKDETANKQLTMLVDRAQGGSSLDDGQLELMMHRRLVHNGGMALEALNETAYGVGLAVRGTHLLVLSSISDSLKLARSLSHQMYKQPLVSFIPTNLSFSEWSQSYHMETKMINEGLPWNVNLLTLDHRPDGKYLLRLEHPYDVGEDLELSKPAVINLNKSLFNGFYITSAEETMLGGNQFKKDSKRFIWKESNHTQLQNLSDSYVGRTVVDTENIVLHPMQIRTFILSIKKTDKLTL